MAAGPPTFLSRSLSCCSLLYSGLIHSLFCLFRGEARAKRPDSLEVLPVPGPLGFSLAGFVGCTRRLAADAFRLGFPGQVREDHSPEKRVGVEPGGLPETVCRWSVWSQSSKSTSPTLRLLIGATGAISTPAYQVF